MPILYIAVGLLLGIVGTVLLMRSKIRLAEAVERGNSEIERTSLNERLKSSTIDLDKSNKRAAGLEEAIAQMRTERESLGRQCSQLTERAARLNDVEQSQRLAQETADKLTKELADLREMNARTATNGDSKAQQLAELQKTHGALISDHDGLLAKQSSLDARIAELTTTLEQERSQTKEKLELLNNARTELTTQFKNLANEILDEKSKKFTEQNKTNLGDLLNPFKEKIEAFQKKVEDCYEKEGKDRSALGEQVKMLTELNNKLSQDAQNLTLALKGDQKAQGNWGEIILENILERGGLQEGQHYDAQGSVESEDGQSRVIPDIVLHLPGNRDLVIDSKLTLPDYRAFVAADNDEERDKALKRHLVSIRSHMKGLCEKKYQSIYGLRSLDCVIMFVPLEPAFMLAVTNDRELFNDGWERNVLLVSPSTLLFVIRTVANLWRQEDISRNARDISSRGAELYDRLVGFVSELLDVGKKLNAAQDSYNEARKKLSEGRGNVIRQAEMLRELGVTPSKTLPQQLIDAASEIEPTCDRGPTGEQSRLNQS